MSIPTSTPGTFSPEPWIACRTALFAIDYDSYLLSNDGATLIYLDADRNPATGWATENLAGDTTIGVDYVLRSYWDDLELKQGTHLYRTMPPEETCTVHQFATPTQANRLYLVLPLESIGLPMAPVDIRVRTASWGGGGSGVPLPNDDLPDTGVVTLATQPGNYLGDLDADGDGDGRDLDLSPCPKPVRAVPCTGNIGAPITIAPNHPPARVCLFLTAGRLPLNWKWGLPGPEPTGLAFPYPMHADRTISW